MKSKSPITTRRKYPPIHPGRILAEDLRDAGISMNQLAAAIQVPPNRISAIVSGKRNISGDTALRLSRFWGTTAAYWMNLQTYYDLETASEAIGKAIDQIQPRSAA